MPLLEEPLLNDIDVGELEGATLQAYRDYKRSHTREDAFPGGESLNDSARRYAEAYERLLATPRRLRARRLPRDPASVRAERRPRVG